MGDGSRRALRPSVAPASTVARGPEPATVLGPDQGLLAADLELLDRPGVAVRIGEAEERATVLGREDHDLAAFDTTTDELGTGRLGIGDDELEPAERTRCDLPLRGQVAEDDRAARATRGELHDVHEL